MSDYDYRSGDYYEEEPINESHVEIENKPVHQSHYNRYDYIPEEPVRDSRKVNKKGNFFTGALKVAGFAVIFGAAAGLAFAGVNKLTNKTSPSASNQQQIQTTIGDESSSEKGSGQAAGNAQSQAAQDVSAVVDQVMPSVVSITGTYRTNNYFGFGSQESQGAGSGFIIAEDDKRLLIATNNHVVADSSSLTVGFVDNTSAAATIVGKDSNADLAVISVNKSDVSDDTRSKIKIATLGSSESLKVGQPVIAIGNALGYGQSVTVGVLSAKDREVSFTDGTMTLLQTDAAINPGNSGGVLINMNGEVIGINNAKLADTSVEGMCYAIPISTANSILNDLMNASDISSENAAYLGIVGKNIDASYSKALGMPQGIYVSQIVSGSPAEESGIEAGDIITAVDGNNVSTMQGLKEKISIKKAGTKMTVTLKRAKQNGEYEEKKIEVTLGKASDFQDASTNNQSGNDNGQNQNGGQNGTDQFGNGGQNGNGGYYYDQGNGNGNGNGNGEEFDPFYYFFN